MDFDQDAVGAGRDRRLGHRRDQIPLACGMAGIHDDRQVGEFLQSRDAERSSVLRYCVSNVRIPRSHSMTF